MTDPSTDLLTADGSAELVTVQEQPGSIRPTLVTWLILSLAVLVPLGMILSTYIVSLVTGAILAVLVYPLYTLLRRRLPPWAAGIVMTLGVAVLVLVPLGALGLATVRQGAMAVGRFSTEATPTLDEFVETSRAFVPFIDNFGSPAELLGELKGGLASLSAAASAFVFKKLQTFPVILLHLVLIVMSLYYSLVDGRRLYAWVGAKLPLSAQIRRMLVASFRSATRAVMLASLAAAAAQSVLVGVGFWALGVPLALLAAGITFVLGWVPQLATVVWASGAIYLYAQGHPVKAVILVVIGIAIGLVDNVARALVLGGQEAMHPMVSIVAVLGGIATFGASGVFIGPLVASMSIAVLDIWPAVASYCGIAVSGSGDTVPDVPMLATQTMARVEKAPPPSEPPT